MFSGKIMSGLGEGAYFVGKYEQLFKDALGFKPFHGTLNVKVDKVPELKNPITIISGGKEQTDASSVKLYPVHCYRGKLKSVEMAVIRPVATRHPADIVEIIAPVCIKEKFNLKDGDEIECSLE